MDARRLGEWLDRLGPALTLYARQWCDSPEDVVQEAFIRLASAEPANVPAWLHRVVRNAAVSAARAERRRRRHETTAARPLFAPASGADTVSDALRHLPADLREVLVAHLWGGLTFADVAAVVGTSPATAHRRYTEALELLRERLGEP